jgi:hypothetical protein
MDSSHWPNGIRHHIFDIRPDTEFKSRNRRVTQRAQFSGPYLQMRRKNIAFDQVCDARALRVVVGEPGAAPGTKVGRCRLTLSNPR